MEVKKRHWAMDLVFRAPSAPQFFRSIGRGKKCKKIWFSENKVFVVEFEDQKHVGTREFERGPYESLLAIESKIEDEMQAAKN